MNREVLVVLVLFFLFFVITFVTLYLINSPGIIVDSLGFLTGSNTTSIVNTNVSGYPIARADGSGCINPNKEGAPPSWLMGPPDGRGACFWESEPIFGTFGMSLKISMLNLTVSPNSVSVNKPLEVLTSDSESCYEEALRRSFASYNHYATFVPDLANGFRWYAVRGGTVSARCIAVKDLTDDGYGYYIDSIGVYQ